MGYQVGIIGASGAVGQELLKVLEHYQQPPPEAESSTSFPVDQVRLYGSSRSAGTVVSSKCFGDLTVQLFQVKTVRKECQVVFLAVSGSFALEHAKNLCKDDGPIVIDNSSAFRYDPDIPLVVPEINGDVTAPASSSSSSSSTMNCRLIANPNCTTAIGVMAVAPLAKAFGLKRLLMSTYQAASGAGQPGMDELLQGTKDQLSSLASSSSESITRIEIAPFNTKNEVFSHPLPFNVIPHIDNFQDNGYTKEEMKVTWETRKICRLSDDTPISCTAVRIPTLRAHSEVIVMETEQVIDVQKAKEIIAAAPGVQLVDDPASNQYPMPMTATGKYDVEAGRFRQSLAFGEYGLEFFVSGDQLLRGAALNAVLIAICMHQNGSLKF